MTYCVRSDVEAQYGVDNVAKWADLNNNENASEIEARIVIACEEADVELNSRLRHGPYSLPFVTPSLGIVRLAATYAGIWLYSARGVVDYSSEGVAQDQLSHQRMLFDKRVRDILAGRYLPDALPAGIKSYPEIWTDVT